MEEKIGRHFARHAREKLLAIDDAAAAGRKLLVGFDGFIDEIIGVVDQRRSMAEGDYTLIPDITAFAARCAAAAGKSTNMELAVREIRFGGNGPLLAGAGAMLGLSTAFIGAIGDEADSAKVHPLFQGFADRCDEVIPVAPPARTEALEFSDGKIMLGRPANVQSVTWERLKEVVGLDRLRERVLSADSISIVNWSLSGGVGGIWDGIRTEILEPAPGPIRPKSLFIDLSDPAKRTDRDIRAAMAQLALLDAYVPVTLGVNVSESQRICRVMGVEPGVPDAAGPGALERLEALRDRLGFDAVILHAHHGAGSATRAGEAAWVPSAFTRSPVISTGAGDHFGGGTVFARTLGFSAPEAVAVGCATSGAYVRDGVSPKRERVAEVLSWIAEGREV